MQVQYTKDINNESILNIIRRFCNYIDHGLQSMVPMCLTLFSRCLEKLAVLQKKN